MDLKLSFLSLATWNAAGKLVQNAVTLSAFTVLFGLSTIAVASFFASVVVVVVVSDDSFSVFVVLRICSSIRFTDISHVSILGLVVVLVNINVYVNV